MRKTAVTLIFGLCLVSASAYADCGNFNQLMKQSQAIQSSVTLGDNPDCSNKPDESVVDDAISCFEGLSGTPARTQSEVDLQLSGLYGVITQCYRSGLGQQEPGKKSFDDLAASTQADPTYEKAWITFSEVIAGFKQQGFFQREAIQIGLGISIDDELQTAIRGLESLPQDPAVSAELAKLQSL